MNTIKKMSLLFTYVMIVATFALQGMNKPNFFPWVWMAGDVILGKTSVEGFQSSTTSSTVKPSIGSFGNLPKNTQKNIISLLSESRTNNLTAATNAIVSLTQTDEDLDQLINRPEFSLELIKSLSKRFDIDNETVCKELRTNQATELLRIQTKLQDMCGTRPNLKDFTAIYQQGAGADPNFTYRGGKTLLHCFIRDSEIILLRFLLKKGANPNFVCQGTYTPLTLSASLGNVQAVEALLEFKADPKLMDGLEMTPIMAAGHSGDQKILMMLNNALKAKK